MQGEKASLTLKQLTDYGVVPVIRTNSQDLAYTAVNSLVGVGFKTVEITMTVPGAVELIKDLSRDRSLLVGAGTVYNAAEVEACIEAGALYVVSPVIVHKMPDVCRESDVLCIMSGLTPNEVLAAWQKGSGAVKVFPVDAMGGHGYLRALKAILPFVPLVPTGGVSLLNIQDYLRAGASFVGVGSDLVSPDRLINGEDDFITENGQKILRAVDTIKKEVI